MFDPTDATPVLLAGFLGIMLAVLAMQIRYWLVSRLKSRRPALPAHISVTSGPAREQQHQVHFVSRHELAECDLICPSCGCVVAVRGDFTRVEQTRIDGQDNEVIQCPGFIGDPADRQPCGMILAASPDTEHGDHLRDDGTVDAVGEHEPSDYYRFKRVDPARVLREKYGLDMKADAEGQMSVAGNAKAVGTDKIEGWVPPEVRSLIEKDTPPTKDTP